MSLCPPRYFVLYKKTNDQYVPGQLLRKNLSIIFLAWRHYWFPREMTSEEQAQQLNTDDASLPRSKIELLTGWRKIFPAARPIRGTFQIWAVPRRTRKIPTNRKRLISIGHEHSDPCLYWLCVIFFFFFLEGGENCLLKEDAMASRGEKKIIMNTKFFFYMYLVSQGETSAPAHSLLHSRETEPREWIPVPRDA